MSFIRNDLLKKTNPKSNLGIDIVFIPDLIKKITHSGTTFLNKIFSPVELAETTKPESLAGKFAAKEAFIKTLPAGTKYQLNKIEILKVNDRPYILFQNKKFKNVSISHQKNYAVAVVGNDYV